MAVNGQAVDVNDRAAAQSRRNRPAAALLRHGRSGDAQGEDPHARGAAGLRRRVTPKRVWVWDWGRPESPTEPQFRSLERETGCYDNDNVAAHAVASFDAAHKAKVPFADLIYQQIPRRRRSSNRRPGRAIDEAAGVERACRAAYID